MSAIPAVPIIAVATHDTASAVAAVPAETDRFAYISSGTWSLVGAEVQSPVITPESLKYNFTNEGGVGGTFRLLKNVLGMWLVQACQDTWAISGERFTDGDLVEMAAAAPPFGPLIDPHPNSPDFRTVGDMPARIRDFCVRTGQSVPIDKGAVLRCIFESPGAEISASSRAARRGVRVQHRRHSHCGGWLTQRAALSDDGGCDESAGHRWTGRSNRDGKSGGSGHRNRTSGFARRSTGTDQVFLRFETLRSHCYTGLGPRLSTLHRHCIV